MVATIKLFESELNHLKHYIRHQEDSSRLLKKIQDEENLPKDFIRADPAKSKIFNYNAYVVSLYGLFERYIENILEEYLTELTNQITSYKELPAIIRKNNIANNGEILGKIYLPKYREVSLQNVVFLLNENLNNDLSTLHLKAFSNHSANFRIGSLDEIFKNIGVNNLATDVRNYSPLKEHLELEHMNMKNLKPSIVFAIIDDLAERRNDVAHGVENIEILHPEIILSYVEFIESFGKALYALLDNLILEFKYNKSDFLIDKIKVIKKRILCAKSTSLHIDSSSKIIVRRNENYPKYVEAKIEEIQIDGVLVDSVSADENVNVGLRLDSRVKITNDFKLVIS